MGDCKFLRQKKQVKINGEWVDTRSYRYLPYCDGSTPSVIVKGGNPNGKVIIGFGKKGGSDHGRCKTISLDASGNGRINMESNDIINEVDIKDNPSSCIVEIFSCNISSLGWGNNADAQKHSDKMSISCSSYFRISNQLFESMNFLGKTIKFNGFDTSKVTDMVSMFSRCRNITSLDLSGWDVSNVTSMTGMFDGCSSLIYLKVPNFDKLLKINMEGMFADCSSLASLDLSGWDTGQVTNMENMFAGCTNLTSLNLSGLAINARIYGMFVGCSSLTTIYMRNCDSMDVAYVEEELKRDGIPLDQVTIIT